MWFVYLLRVAESNSLYCGITNNLENRIAAHRQGKGAKYLRGKKSISLVWFMTTECRSSASKLEIAIKQLPKKHKEAIVTNAPMPYRTV